jgi:ubiquinone/menaquinone biosynthesis C-methylase UbiE
MNSPDQIKLEVRNHYTKVVNTSSSCCGSACGCGTDVTFADPYAGREGYVAEADLGLGCGIPTDVADIQAGNTVVDLGSGAGNDCFVARHLVGESGRVIGVDFTPAMVRKAQEHATKRGFTNVEFVRGEIEQIPLDAGVADVVVSNCVLNLVPDKRKAFAEMYRIIKSGGHFAVSDTVTRGTLTPDVKSAAVLYAGCVSGAIDRDEYVQLLREASFQEVSIRKERAYDLTDEYLAETLSAEQINAFRGSGSAVLSITVTGRKPA